ncbi:MAG: hypothetical protein B0W54_21505 [Cellvibrio sp. 79]|nr:MAG: hypothetical protein B0W54_21505 [Cellvibrio sp. 79]
MSVLEFQKKLNEIESFGGSPYFNVVEAQTANSKQLRKFGSVVDYTSCDFLNFSSHPEVIDAFIASAKDFGITTNAAQIFSGYTIYHEELEFELSQAFSKSISLFPTCTHANLSVLTSLFSKGDLIIHDEMNHYSLFIASRASYAETKIFPHNDYAKLELILANSNAKNKLVCIEGFNSANGNYPDIPLVLSICKKYGAKILVDESHSFGVFGPNNLGVCDFFGVTGQVDYITTTFNKALGSHGGMLAASQVEVAYLRHLCGAYTSSRGMAPPLVAAALKAFKLLGQVDGNNRRLKAWENQRGALAKLSFIPGKVVNSQTLGIPFCLDVAEAELPAKTAELIRSGVLVSSFVYPSVPRNGHRIRFCITAQSDLSGIDKIASLMSR